VQFSQDNHNNMVKKLKKEKNSIKDCLSTTKEASSKEEG
jgi:hypothetical protein